MAKFLISAFADEAHNGINGQVEALKRNRLFCIEPRAMNFGAVLAKTDEELAAIKKRFDDEGIIVPSFGSPIGKYKITDDFEPHLASFRRALQVCKALDTKRMRIFSFFVPQDKLDEYRDEVIRRMKIMVAEATEAGITLCHENESEIYGQEPERVADLLASVPGLRAIYDPANYVYYESDPVKGLEATLPYFEYMHVKDCLYEGHTLVPAGAGEGRLKEALQKIDATIDGEVVLTVEPHLFVSESYKQFDGKELKNKFVFATADEAFDYAVNALKEMLAEIGHPVENGRA